MLRLVIADRFEKAGSQFLGATGLLSEQRL